MVVTWFASLSPLLMGKELAEQSIWHGAKVSSASTMDAHTKQAWSIKKPIVSNLGKSRYFFLAIDINFITKIACAMLSVYKDDKAHRRETKLALYTQAGFACGSNFRSVAHPRHLGTPASGLNVSVRWRDK
jgi:hypothetical protein